MHEDLVQYRYDLASDLMLFGVDDGGVNVRYDTMSPADLWVSTRETIALDSKLASLDFGPVDANRLRTKLGQHLLTLVHSAPHSSLITSGSNTLNIVCGNAEPGFMKSMITRTHKNRAPLLIAHNGQIDAMMKFNADGEHTILGLTNDDIVVEGGLYGVLSDVDDALVDARAGSGLAIIESTDFYDAVGMVYPERQTSFMIDDDIRAAFAEAMHKGPDGIVGIDDVYERVNRMATIREKEARARGAQIIELLNTKG